MTAPNRRPAPRLVPAALGLALVLALAACGDDDTTAGTDGGDGTTTTAQEHGCGVAEGGRVTVVAKDLAWDVDCLQAPEGVPLTIEVDNQDVDVAHNLHVTDLPGDPATELEDGVITQELDLGAELPVGEYDYVCDIHPNMTGTLEILAPLAEGPVTTGQ